MTEFFNSLPSLIGAYGFQILGAIATFIIGRWVAGMLVNGAKKAMQTSKVDKTLSNFAGNILYYLLFAIVIVAALSILGIPTTSVVAILGGLTLALGLALQDSLGNLAAGIMIILLRPYKLGDVVELNGETGEVTEVKIFHTQLTTPVKKTVYIPNNQVIGGNIVNYTEKGIYRYDMVFGIGYGDDIKKAKEILLEIMKSDERIASEPEPVVVVGELADSSVNLVAMPWIRFEDHPGVSANLTEQVKLRYDEAGISIPFPQQDVHMFNAN
ncbi:MAG: mechanosensitive ion channel domain-containing protein [Chloroflexota bacterium]